MKKIVLTFIAAALGCCGLGAQESKVSQLMDKVSIGADLGFSIPHMRYSSDYYSAYKKGSLFSGMGGLFVDWNFYGDFSLQPHLNFIGRGGRMRYPHYNIDYKLKSAYFDIRVPVVYTFNFLESKFKPYVAAGTTLSFACGGDINYSDGSGKNAVNYSLDKLNKSNFRPVDFGLYAGAGCTYPISISGFNMLVGAELGYNLGLVNTFSKAELEGNANAINLSNYIVEGTRKNSNLVIAVNVTIPLKSIFGKRKPKKAAPVSAPVIFQKPLENKPVATPQKQCCSLDEMYDLILSRQDVSNKKICAFSEIRFDFDRATIRPESEEYLDKFVLILKKYPNLQISITGHTDNTGDKEYNMRLSRARAESVARYFINNGIEADRLHSYGRGDRQPLGDNSTKEGRALNRRVEFDIVTAAE